MIIYRKQILFLSLLFAFIFAISAQEIKKDSTRHQANIKEIIRNSTVSYEPVLSPLRQIAGAPKAHWTNYWEFGDGDYSFEEKPVHTYKKSGNYNVILSATNNYDDGKPPTSRPKGVSVNITNEGSDVASSNESHQLIDSFNGFRIQNNRDPSPNEEMQIVVSYANTKDYPTNGKLYLFFNERKYKDSNFVLTDIRTHFGEVETEDDAVTYNTIKSKNKFIHSTGIENIVPKNRILSDSVRQDLYRTLDAAKLFYKDAKVWDVNDVKPKEERNIFFTFKTTPEMLKDTSAVITIRSVYVPDRELNEHKIVEKEMEIVTSHDPNKMSVYNTYMNYRLVRFKRLKYKIKFQNNGEGPASLIKLNTDIPEMLDKSTLKILDMYPKVPMCPVGKEVTYSCMDTVISQDQISFQFKNIYLPGSSQKGVHKKDSTKGFVKYSMKFSKNFHKKKSTSKTAIIFDKNPPIITNSSTSRFKRGLSIGAKSGYNYYLPSNEDTTVLGLDKKTSDGYFIGATFSPYKSYKWYYQAEIIANSQQSGFTHKNEEIIDDPAGLQYLVKTNSDSNFSRKYIELVPASIRYNINSVIGLGLGTHVSFNMYQKNEAKIEKHFFEYDQGFIGDELLGLAEKGTNTDINKNLNIYNYGIFADVTIGISRLGPSVGIRYMQNFNKPTRQIHTYAIWKF